MQRENGHYYIIMSHWIFFSVFSNPPGVYNPPAVPSGAAQGAHHPLAAGTRGEIQAARLCLALGPGLWWYPVTGVRGSH